MDIKKKMFLMSGVPGSGKSFLADQIAELYSAIVCSADDYFMKSGTYNFDRTKLGHAHAECRYNAQTAIQAGYNVVVDNTNVSHKELKPYIDMALAANYDIFVVRPNTPWANDTIECHKRCTHNVPLETIQRMDLSLVNLMIDEAGTKEKTAINDYKVIKTIKEIES